MLKEGTNMSLKRLLLIIGLQFFVPAHAWRVYFDNLTSKTATFNVYVTGQGSRQVRDASVPPFGQDDYGVSSLCPDKVEGWITIKVKDIVCNKDDKIRIIEEDKFYTCEEKLPTLDPEKVVALHFERSIATACSDVRFVLIQDPEGTYGIRKYDWRDSFYTWVDNTKKQVNMDNITANLMSTVGLKPPCIVSSALTIKKSVNDAKNQVYDVVDAAVPQLDLITQISTDIYSARKIVSDTTQDAVQNIKDELAEFDIKPVFQKMSVVLGTVAASVGQLKEIIRCTPPAVINRVFVPYLENASKALLDLNVKFASLNTAKYMSAQEAFDSIQKTVKNNSATQLKTAVDEIKKRTASIKTSLDTLNNYIRDYNDVMLGIPEAANQLASKVLEQLSPHEDDIKQAVFSTGVGKGLAETITSIADKAGIAAGPEGALAAEGVALGANMAESILIASTTSTSGSVIAREAWAKDAIAEPVKALHLEKIFKPMPAMLTTINALCSDFVALVAAIKSLKKGSRLTMPIVMPNETESIIVSYIPRVLQDLMDAVNGMTGKARSKTVK